MNSMILEKEITVLKEKLEILKIQQDSILEILSLNYSFKEPSKKEPYTKANVKKHIKNYQNSITENDGVVTFKKTII